MISALVSALAETGVELDVELIAEVTWLALHLPIKQHNARSAPADSATSATNSDTSSVELLNERPPQSEDLPHGEDGDLSDEASADVFAFPGEGIARSGGSGGVAIRTPGGSALPGVHDIRKALRPMMRKVESRIRKVIDEEATVQRIAELGIWNAVLKPAPSRWLTATVVIDDSEKMLMWRKTVSELLLLLERQGAFQDVRVWHMDASSERPKLYAGARRVERHPRELFDASGRQLIMIVSDCTAPAWYGEGLPKVIEEWGRKQPVCILQLLPQKLWPQTGLVRTQDVRVRSSQAGIANARLTTSQRRRSAIPGETRPDRIAIPVVTLDREYLEPWARLVAGRGDPTVAISFTSPPGGKRVIVGEVSHGEAVAHFRRLASPTALELATLFAAVPLTLPIMRLIQQAMLPKSRQSHLAEILISGLIVPEFTSGVIDPETVRYEFVSEAVREELLDSGRTADAVHALWTVLSTDLSNRMGSTVDFIALIRDPDAAGDIFVSETDRPFANVAAKVLERLGGQYALLARKLVETPPRVGRQRLPVDKKPTQHAGPRVATRSVGRRRAVLIGIDEFADSKLVNLTFCANEALDLESALRERGFECYVVLNQHATRVTILSTLMDVCTSSSQDDLIWFHYSGHTVTVGNRPAILSHEAKGPHSVIELRDIVDLVQRKGLRIVITGFMPPFGVPPAGIAYLGGRSGESSRLTGQGHPLASAMLSAIGHADKSSSMSLREFAEAVGFECSRLAIRATMEDAYDRDMGDLLLFEKRIDAAKFEALPNRTVAVVVGIEDYRLGVKFGLAEAAKSSIEFAQFLIRRGVPMKNIQLFLSDQPQNESFLPTGLTAERASMSNLAAYFKNLYRGQGDLFFLFWSGPGIHSNNVRRLLYADSTGESLEHLEVESLLKFLRSESFSRLSHQILVLDVTEIHISDSVSIPLPSPMFSPWVDPNPSANQFVLISSLNPDAVGGENRLRFSRELTALLDADRLWPPDMTIVAATLKDRLGEEAVGPRSFSWRGRVAQLREPAVTATNSEVRPTFPPSATERRVSIEALPSPPELFVGRQQELALLDTAWERGIKLVQVVGRGGSGKTALITNWAQRRASDATVFAWSFYHLASFKKNQNPENFYVALLEFLEVSVAENMELRDKVEAIARHLSEVRVLLILDGMETLQDKTGTLEDATLRGLLQQLVDHNKGLVVCPTRIALTDFAKAAVTIELENLSPDEGADFLRHLGVKGTDEELRNASVEFDNHALTLKLLGNYLSLDFDGDVKARTSFRAAIAEQVKPFDQAVARPPILRAFISSTFGDLSEYRLVAKQVLEVLAMTAIRMEDVEASDRSLIEVSTSLVASVELFIGIYGFQYGYIPPGLEYSVAELEYRVARDRGIPIFAFMISEDVLAHGHKVDEDRGRITRFRSEIISKHLVSYVRDSGQFSNLLFSQLAEWTRRPQYQSASARDEVEAQNSIQHLTETEAPYRETTRESSVKETADTAPRTGKRSAMRIGTDVPVTYFDLRQTHRLVPSRYAEGDAFGSALAELSESDLEAVRELDAATNERLATEREDEDISEEVGTSVSDLVAGRSYAHIVNAAFTHPSPGGGRFNSSARGAWYAALQLDAAFAEVNYYFGRLLSDLAESSAQRTYTDYLADLSGDFCDLRATDSEYWKYLSDENYEESQRFAEEVLTRGLSGIVYPSLRHEGGELVVCFRPQLVSNVRRGSTYAVDWTNTSSRELTIRVLDEPRE